MSENRTKIGTAQHNRQLKERTEKTNRTCPFCHVVPESPTNISESDLAR